MSVQGVCSSLQAEEEISMTRNVGQIIARGDRRWLIRVYLGHDHETKKRDCDTYLCRSSAVVTRPFS